MATPEPRIIPKCSKGHSMDPNWISCPYCEAEKRSQQKTANPKNDTHSGDRRTIVGTVPPKSSQRITKQMAAQGPPADPGGHIGKGETRRIVGAVITYTWLPQGDLFPIREGRNFIGSGKVSSDSSHPECHVTISVDARMSSEHALILCRHGMHEIIDQASSNGTFVNGKMLMANQSIELSDYAEIKAGDTLFTFVKIKPPNTRPRPDAHKTDQTQTDDTPTGEKTVRGKATRVK